jgi:hypothetical protein
LGGTPPGQLVALDYPAINVETVPG